MTSVINFLAELFTAAVMTFNRAFNKLLHKNFICRKRPKRLEAMTIGAIINIGSYELEDFISLSYDITFYNDIIV